MASRGLIIITRRYGGEFEDYWLQEKDRSFIYKKISDSFVVIQNGKKIKTPSNLPSLLDYIEPQRLKDTISNAGQLGIICHGFGKKIQLPSLVEQFNISFITWYSAVKRGTVFCDSSNGSFVDHSNPSIERKGKLDAFRDAIVFDKGEKIESVFKELWSYFEMTESKEFCQMLRKEEGLSLMLENPYYEKYLGVNISEFGTLRSFIKHVIQGNITDTQFWKVLDHLPEKLINQR